MKSDDMCIDNWTGFIFDSFESVSFISLITNVLYVRHDLICFEDTDFFQLQTINLLDVIACMQVCRFQGYFNIIFLLYELAFREFSEETILLGIGQACQLAALIRDGYGKIVFLTEVYI